MDNISNYIEAGEFTFCSRCGSEDSVRIGRQSFMCSKCTHGGLGLLEHQTEGWGQGRKDELKLKIKYERWIGEMVYEYRQELGALRRSHRDTAVCR